LRALLDNAKVSVESKVFLPSLGLGGDSGQVSEPVVRGALFDSGFGRFHRAV
jgi:hypothetical protein